MNPIFKMIHRTKVLYLFQQVIQKSTCNNMRYFLKIEMLASVGNKRVVDISTANRLHQFN